MGNVWISLWEERPIVIMVKDESAGAVEGSEIKKAKLTAEDVPVLEKVLLGKLRVKTNDWLLNT
jgi:hypothetical protein